MNQPFIECRDLSFAYEGDRNEVLHRVSFSVEKGAFVAILGHNGSGKSTLAKLLNLILTPSSGTVKIDGKEVKAADLSEDEIFEIRKKVGMVFQNPDNQIVATVVEEDVAFGPENLGLPPEEIRRRVDGALDAVKMSDFRSESPHRLSGGQKQRIAIAGVIAMEPECIIFDESTAMLDPLGRKDVMNIIRRLNREKGITILHITHNMNEAVLADRVLVINDGTLYMDGTPTEVFSQVERLRSVGLDVPQVTELFYELKREGVPLPDGVLDAEKGAERFLSLCQ